MIELTSFDVSLAYKQSRVLIDFPDGKKAFITHKSVIVIFKHKLSGDEILFRRTGKDKFYRQAMLERKEQSIEEREYKSELVRLTNPETAIWIDNAVVDRLQLGK